MPRDLLIWRLCEVSGNDPHREYASNETGYQRMADAALAYWGSDPAELGGLMCGANCGDDVAAVVMASEWRDYWERLAGVAISVIRG